MKRVVYSILLGMAVFACGVLQAATIKKGVVAKTNEEMVAMNALSDKELTAQMDSLDGQQVTEQVVAMNDGNHAELLARVLVTVKVAMKDWSDSKQDAVAVGLNSMTKNIEVKDQKTADVKIYVKTVNGNMPIDPKMDMVQLTSALQISAAATATTATAKATETKAESEKKAAAKAAEEENNVETSALTNSTPGNSAAGGSDTSFRTGSSLSPYAGSPYAQKNATPTSSSPFQM